jgi:hypothetical protein
VNKISESLTNRPHMSYEIRELLEEPCSAKWGS